MEYLDKNNKDLLRRITIYCMFLLSFSGYFFIAYFIESTPCPKWISNIDKNIPFIWWMIIPYYFYYIILLLPPVLINDLFKINFLTKTLIETSIFCYIIYILWPISSTDILINVSQNPLFFLHNFITFDFLHQNAFPSMHVSITTVIALAIKLENKNLKYQMYLSILLIFLATFLIKQHYVVDSISGLIIGYMGFLRYQKLLKT